MNIDYLEHLPVVLEMHFSVSERRASIFDPFTKEIICELPRQDCETECVPLYYDDDKDRDYFSVEFLQYLQFLIDRSIIHFERPEFAKVVVDDVAEGGTADSEFDITYWLLPVDAAKVSENIMLWGNAVGFTFIDGKFYSPLLLDLIRTPGSGL